jgi:hypothetical protein
MFFYIAEYFKWLKEFSKSEDVRMEERSRKATPIYEKQIDSIELEEEPKELPKKE